MASVLSILDRLEATTSRLEKEAILKQHAGNMTLMRAFQLALDPRINFYIKKVPEPGPNPDPSWYWNLYEAFGSMETWLAGRKVRGNEASDWLARLLGTLTREDQEVVRRVIGRNLRCGVSEATVEKIWPEHLKLGWPCMLVSPMSTTTKVKFPCIVQTKMDGMRFNAHVQGGQVIMRSRVGKELVMDGLATVHEEFEQFPDGIYDGELLVVGCDRKTGNGILTKFQKGTGTAQDGRHVRAKLWDFVDPDAFKTGVWDVPYKERFVRLSGLLKNLRPRTISLVETWLDVPSMAEAQKIYREQLARGEEGVILKSPLGPWEDKRVRHQVKLKAELEADLLCTGVAEGAGKYATLIGSLECESAEGQVRVSVGTGLTDEDRSRPASDYVGKIVAVKYNAVITDKKTGAKSLFLPVFIEVREDKRVPDKISE